MAELTAGTATVGTLLGVGMIALLLYVICPVLDNIVKKNRGIYEAMFCTRFCAIVVGFPLYFITVWMTVVIIADGQKGISVIDELCPNNYGCANSFAWGRSQFDKSACTDASCSTDELEARSGSQPLHFKRLGLGQDLTPTTKNFDFTCVTLEDGACLIAEVDGENFACDDLVETNGVTMCAGYSGFNNDIRSTVFETTCTTVEGELCVEWTTDTDSNKQFSFQTCECTSDDCSEFSCEVFTMKYYYPNIFYAALATTLFVLPSLFVTYFLIKEQLAKILKCQPLKMGVFSQDAGYQEETTPENLATGGFAAEQNEKSKNVTLTPIFFGYVFGGLFVTTFFSWIIVQVSGRVGVAFLSLAAIGIMAYEVKQLLNHIQKQKELDAVRVNNNRGNPNQATL